MVFRPTLLGWLEQPPGARLMSHPSLGPWPITRNSSARSYHANIDMGTQVATAVQQGAQNFRCVRVTDATDTAAYTVVPGSNASFTALYTGSLGNNITLALGTGSQPNSWKLSVLLPGFEPEVYDGLVGDGATFWTGLASAVNSGLGSAARAVAACRC